MSIFIGAFFMIFFAEMGDKSQLMAFSLTSCYKVKTILMGIVISTIINNGAAVFFGAYISNIINLELITIISAMAFLGFGLWTLWEKEEGIDTLEHSQKCGFGSLVSVATLFTLAELGDKTQLATAVYAANHGSPLLIFGGVMLGMLTADAIGIFLGYKLKDKFSYRKMKLFSSFIFFGLGFISLISSSLLLWVKLLIIALVLIVILWKYRTGTSTSTSH
ncbi:TMEM165/GDT1 family protein [Natranaerobius thermophilus]|uniref:GDT1 family protein n=1 Tax=Natranaerobius thermophilus (strain ATCC BAA-1301 / DSM 18059 / JW/NM-WN-LF) TaxID=457570 RepID=B2A1I0_NATTJ|nr:TMEM165/GDT1 family protein [Natranaerobius thermophilus]ACB84720.1 protein of unknown function UPF0016 [Natranaerobius thermophilus JW/NM-WN-LF]